MVFVDVVKVQATPRATKENIVRATGIIRVSIVNFAASRTIVISSSIRTHAIESLLAPIP